MESMQKNAQPEPEWEPIEDWPPRIGFFEKVVMPGVLIVGILYVLIALADAVFFGLGSRDDQIAIAFGGVVFVMLWVADKVMGVI